MTDERDSQQSQPKKGEPVEIPVPTREEIDRLLKKAAQPLRRDGSTGSADK